MNQRLVESVAQIILSMTDDERRLLDNKLRTDGSRRLPEPSDTEKSLRIAELAQEIHEFEEMYHTPLSELPAERWTVADPNAQANGNATEGTGNATGNVTNGVGKSSSNVLPNTLRTGVLVNQPDTETADKISPQPLSAFLSLTQLMPEESAEDDHSSYSLYDLPT